MGYRNGIQRLGDGHYLTRYIDKCRNCLGCGSVDRQNTGISPEASVTCPVCQGSGQVVVKKEIKITVEPYRKGDV